VEPFVGREVELGRLHTEFDAARRGEPRLVLIQGAAGMGKTALLHRLLADIAADCVLRANGEEAEASLAFGVVEQLARQITGPASERLSATLGLRPRPDPVRVGAELVDLLGQLETNGPVSLVIDDLQWADVPSLQALVFALRRLHADQVLTLLLVRDNAIDSLPGGLHRLLAARSGMRIKLDGLTTEELRALAIVVGTGPLSARALERVQRLTGGSPLHARALLEELAPEVLESPLDPLPAPRSYSTLVLARLAACGPDTRELVTAAAVLGVRCELLAAGKLAGIDEPLLALEQATGAHILVERPALGGRQVEFTHPLVRAAVYHDLGVARRAALHLRAAELAGDPAAALWHRAVAANAPDAALADDLARFAAGQLAGGAWAAAAEAFEAAARLSPARADQESLLLQAIEYQLVAGTLPTALALADELGGFADSARRRYVLGRVALVTARSAEAQRLLEGAWSTCDTEREPELAGNIAGLLATIFQMQANGAMAALWGRRAIEIAPVSAAASNAMDMLLFGLGYSAHIEEGLTLAAALPDPAGLTGSDNLDGLVGLGGLLLWSDDVARAREVLAATAGAYHQRGLPPMGLAALAALAYAEYRLGAWDDAIIHGEQAASGADDTEQYWLQAHVHTAPTFPLAARGSWQAAEAHVMAAWSSARLLNDDGATAYAAIAEAHLARAMGDPQRMLTALAPIPALANRNSLDAPGITPWQELSCEALLDLGRVDEAEAVLAAFEARAASSRQQLARMEAARLQGRLQAARRRMEAAEAAFDEGLGYAEQLRLPFERALLHDAFGRFLRRLGRRTDAITQLSAARTRFAQLGATPYLDRCDRELRACGVAPIGPRERGTARLTPQELSVARLVAGGRTNREVARELVVSVKTVEYHLGHVYAKLGITSRSQLALQLGSDQEDP
jgi:DNA-binding CsgD family transcriptional regulator